MRSMNTTHCRGMHRGTFQKCAAALVLSTILSSDAGACSLSELFTQDDARFKSAVYAGDMIHVSTLKLDAAAGTGRSTQKRTEYVSLIRELDLGTYIVVDKRGKDTTVDIFVDKDADGVLDAHYHLVMPRNILSGVGLAFETRSLERRVRKAYIVLGRDAAVNTLEHNLEAYRTSIDLGRHQSRYAASLEALRGEFCSLKIAQGADLLEK